jgi:DNA-directed RNA polymerase specialized sigma24 family protein
MERFQVSYKDIKPGVIVIYKLRRDQRLLQKEAALLPAALSDERRREPSQEVRERYRQGWSFASIARKLGMHKKTVAKREKPLPGLVPSC